MAIVNYVRNGRRFGDRKMLTGAKIPKMSLQAYDSCWPLAAGRAGSGSRPTLFLRWLPVCAPEQRHSTLTVAS